MSKRKARSTSGDKTICLPMPPDVEYEVFVEDTAGYRTYLNELIVKHPELFPAEISEGYCFHGFVESDKLHLRTRRIRLKRNRQAYQLGRANLKFVSKDVKTLPRDSRKVTPVSHESAPRGKRIQGRNRISKADHEPEKRILVEQLRLFD